jgi:hypothetical protein
MHLTIDLTTGDSTLYCPTSLHADDHVLWCGMSIQVMKGRGEELETYRVKYGFLISLSPTFWYLYLSYISDEFLGLLVETAFNEAEPAHTRVACLSYLSSLSARAVFLPHETVSSLVTVLTAYCLRSTKRDAIWFGAYQAAVYILTTRWRDLELKGLVEPVVGIARRGGLRGVDLNVGKEFCGVLHGLGLAYLYPFLGNKGECWFPFDGGDDVVAKGLWKEYEPFEDGVNSDEEDVF